MRFYLNILGKGLIYNSNRKETEIKYRGKMVEKEIYNQMCTISGRDYVYVDEPMSRHTTFRIGGPADYFIHPQSREEVREIVRLCTEKKLDYYILGNGSNLLVSDAGFRGVMIQIYQNMSRVRAEKQRLFVQAGALLSQTAKTAAEEGLTGLEFAAGIPGTVGGAVTMNAGAYGGEMKEITEAVTVLDREGKIRRLKRNELEFGYRKSAISKYGYIVLEAELLLQAGDREQILEKIEDLCRKRKEKQPLEFASAGSTFKRPEGYYAGKLIMDAGLCGFSIGDAQISEKHCGFLINKGNATASEVMALISHVRIKVKELFGVELEPEVKLLGDFEPEKQQLQKF